MSVSYSPKSITNGLVLCLDSTNPKSYPGSGTKWYDISGYGNHGTLNNFTGAAAGSLSGFDLNTSYMMFDRHVGVGDGVANNYVSVPSSTSLTDCLSQNGVSVEIWLKMTTYYCTALTRWAGPWEVYYCSGLVHRTIGTGGSDGSTGVAASTYLNQFHQIVATHDGFNRRVYVNGSQVFADINIVTAQDSTATMGIGAYNNGNYAFMGAMPIFRVYNRPLSAGEVQTSFNATKGKFRI